MNILLTALLSTLYLFATTGSQFAIDYENDTFTMDGQPFRYISGSMHYFRCPWQYWRDRLRKLREAGLNAVSTYVEWSQHEKIPGIYNFSGDLNVTHFVQIAREEGLYVILRPGPYICAERDMGGLPYWLLKHPHIRLRTSDTRYTKYVKIWMDVLLSEIKPLLYGNGGPIILVQVENEYGSYYACDRPHLLWLRDLFTEYVEDKAVLFTTDGAGVNYLKCGKIPGVYATVDFGPDTNITSAFGAQRAYEPRGPLVNSEFYPGWLTHWGEALSTTDTESVISTLEEMLEANANINFYMFHGGSNFGFTAGANYGSAYQSDITSYDYDAPLTEGGDTTPKYDAIRNKIAEYSKKKIISNRKKHQSKGNYREVTLKRVANLLSDQVRQTLGRTVTNSPIKSFEVSGQNYGYLLYETAAPYMNKTKNLLNVTVIHDRAVVFVDGEAQDVLDRESKKSTCTINTKQGDTLSILVENLGRINYGSLLNDSKGILSDVKLGKKVLAPWNLTHFEFLSIDPIVSCFDEGKSSCLYGDKFVFYASKFEIKGKEDVGDLPDTYLNVTDMSKGLAFINGFNLGRFWSTKGPQFSLYLPGVYLKKAPEQNILIVMDENINLPNITLKFSPKPIWNTTAVKIRKG